MAHPIKPATQPADKGAMNLKRVLVPASLLLMTLAACDSKDDPGMDARPADAAGEVKAPDVAAEHPADQVTGDGGVPDLGSDAMTSPPDAPISPDVVADTAGPDATDVAPAAMDMAASDATVVGSGSAVGACPTLTASATLEGDIDTDQIWRGALALKGEVRVLGATITIEPGTTLIMEPDASIAFGADGTDGRLLALGTDTAGIRFCGKEATRGSWEGVVLGAQLAEATLRYVTISDGGKTAPVFQAESALAVDHVTMIENKMGVTITGPGFTPTSTTLTVINTTQEWAVRVEPDAAITMPKGGLYLTGNQYPSILIDGQTYRATGTLPKLDAPFRIEGTLTITDGASLSVEAGSTIIMGNGAAIHVGTDGDSGTLVMAGTGAKPIVLVGASLEAGHWSGITFGADATDNCLVDYVQLRGGGRDIGAAVVARRPVSITHTMIKGSGGFGIRRDSGDPTDYITGNSFEECFYGAVGPLVGSI
jgi:ethanolamine utilization protein EutQ (cupin superfamily)